MNRLSPTSGDEPLNIDGLMNKVWTLLILAVVALAFGLWLASDLRLKKPVPDKTRAEPALALRQTPSLVGTTNGATVVEAETSGATSGGAITAFFKPGEERYANGNLMARGTLKSRPDGTSGHLRGGTNEWVKHGPWTNYWANGAINTFGEYENGEKIGAWPFWLETGAFLITNQHGVSKLLVARKTTPPV
ncbi:MAG: hypothetical protein HY360_15890, partial [Verrucomicrobia bacterium]|nr:hypothetical protein [Verrucomicrobiota bacterium]